MGAYAQILQDKDFLSAAPKDQAAYLSHVDPDFAKASPADQTAYLSFLTTSGARSGVPKPATPNMQGSVLPEVTRAGTSVLPMVGGVAGAMIGTPADVASGPGGTIAGAGLGAAAGRSAELNINRSLFGNQETSPISREGLASTAATGALAAASEGAIPALAKAGQIAKAVARTPALRDEAIGVVSPRAAHALKLAKFARNIQRAASGTEEAGAAAETAAAQTSGTAATNATPQATAKTTGAQLEQQLNEALGGKPLQKDLPLKQQIPTLADLKTGPPGTSTNALPPGHTPVSSSAVSSFKYDASTQELEIHPTSGSTTYRYGDVSPEQAAQFQNAKSVGKAWQQIRQGGSPLVAKRVGGKWIPVKPAAASSPDDLTSVLQQSLSAARAKKTLSSLP